MPKRLPIALAPITLVLAAVAMFSCQSETNVSPSKTNVSLESVQQALNADAAKGRFTGPLGDFMIYSQLGLLPATLDPCFGAITKESVQDETVLRQSDLWSDAFGPSPFGTSCDHQLVGISNGMDPLPDGTESVIKMYFAALPAPVAFDAPRDRIELIEIAGHPAIIEHPVEGYPYAHASLAVIERYPSAAEPGIVAYVNMAPSAAKARAWAQRLVE